MEREIVHYGLKIQERRERKMEW